MSRPPSPYPQRIFELKKESDGKEEQINRLTLYVRAASASDTDAESRSSAQQVPFLTPTSNAGVDPTSSASSRGRQLAPNQPTNRPTDQPTNRPTDQPTNRPTDQPTDQT